MLVRRTDTKKTPRTMRISNSTVHSQTNQSTKDPFHMYSLSPMHLPQVSTVSRGHNSLVSLAAHAVPPPPPSIHPNHHGQKYLPGPSPLLLRLSLCYSSVWCSRVTEYADLSSVVCRVRVPLLILFFDSFYALYSTLLHLPPIRFHCVGGCWNRTQDCCDFGIGSQTL